MPETSTDNRRGRPRCGKARQCILDAALQMKAEKPISRISIEGIARYAGTGKSTIYRWWPSKGLLFLEAYLHKREVPDDASFADLAVEYFAGGCGRMLVQLLGEAQHDAALMSALHTELFDRMHSAYQSSDMSPGRYESALGKLVFHLMTQPDAFTSDEVEQIVAAYYDEEKPTLRSVAGKVLP